MERGDINVLNMLKDNSFVSDEEFEYYLESFYNFSQGKGVKFTL